MSLVVLAVLIWRVILPELHDGRAAFVALESVSFAAIAVAVVLEMASLVVFQPPHPSRARC